MTWIHFRKEFLYKNTGSNRVKYEMISSNHMCRDFRLLHIYIYMPRQHCKVFARRRRSKRYNGHAYSYGVWYVERGIIEENFMNFNYFNIINLWSRSSAQLLGKNEKRARIILGAAIVRLFFAVITVLWLNVLPQHF